MNISNKKIFFYFFIIIIINILIFLKYKPNLKQKYLFIKNNLNLNADYINENKINQNQSKQEASNLFPAGKWLMNGVVSQYSSVASLANDNKIVIETLSYINNKKTEQDTFKHIKCLVKIEDKLILKNKIQNLGIALMGTRHGTSNIWRITCVIEPEEHLNKLSSIYVSTIDVRNYLNLTQDQNYIMFQKAQFFNRTTPKKKGIINCVHMVNRLDNYKFYKLKNWIRIQREIGYLNVRLYFHYISKNMTNEILNEYKNFVQIVDYKTDLVDVCDWYSNLLKSDENSTKLNDLYNNCKHLKNIFLDMNDGDVVNTHERMCSNDCLLRSKYEYEYLSNYDFDEFIFPRNFKTNYVDDYKNSFNYNYSFIETNNSTSDQCNFDDSKIPNLKYDIYSYINKLVEKYGKNVGYFHFENILFTPTNTFLFNKILELNNRNLSLLREVESIEHNVRNALVIKYSINKYKDLEHLKTFKYFHLYTKCLNETIKNNSNINKIFNQVYSVLVNNRAGKSIYNTEFTESYNQHFAWEIKLNSIRVDVPLELGYVNHFREDILGFVTNQNFNYVFFDIEYYNFLYHLSKNF